MIHNDIKRGLLANTLALHDFQTDTPDVKGWFYYVESWMLKHGLTPTKMEGKGDKNIPFARGENK